MLTLDLRLLLYQSHIQTSSPPTVPSAISAHNIQIRTAASKSTSATLDSDSGHDVMFDDVTRDALLLLVTSGNDVTSDVDIVTWAGFRNSPPAIL